MNLANHKTKIVCTIGPATDSPEMLTKLIQNGMNVARVNCSHGTADEHRATIDKIRAAAKAQQQPVAVMIDLPGPKIRIGELQEQPLMLQKGDRITLTTRDVKGKGSLIPVNFEPLPQSVAAGSPIFLNDGFIQLETLKVSGPDVLCRVIVGGPLSSHKGLNLPGARVKLDPVTPDDLQWLEFGLREGVHIFAASFIERAQDIRKLKQFAEEKGESIFVLAKIERQEAVENIDDILQVADGVMVARGDLGVQIPIEQVPVVQKTLIRKANRLGRPVITATQMLESMTQNIRPTRAEVSDVANAILDGADAVMLSGETAVGAYPVETVAMMSRIAEAAESRLLPVCRPSDKESAGEQEGHSIENVISRAVVGALHELDILYILTPTQRGVTSQFIASLKPSVWTLAFTWEEKVHEFLLLSYGVRPFLIKRNVKDWPTFAREFLRDNGPVKDGGHVILTQGRDESGGTDSMQIIPVTVNNKS